MLKDWPPKDWRAMLAVLFLAGGGMAITVSHWRIITALIDGQRWQELGYNSYGLLVLIGIVLTGFSVILGKRSFKASAGPVSIEANGEDDD